MSFKIFNKYADRYDAWYEKQGKRIYLIELNALKEYKSMIYSLEVGVGSGRFAGPLEIEIGIDPSFKMMKLAANRVPNLICGCGENLPFREESISIVFLIVTICFVEEPIKILEEAYRVLKSNGMLVVGIVPRNSVWGRYYLRRKETGHAFYSHAKFYTYSEVISMLHESGFIIRKTLSTLLQSPGKVLNIENPREGYIKNAGFIIVECWKKNRFSSR